MILLSLDSALQEKQVIGTITTELLNIIATAPKEEQKEKYIHAYLSSRFSDSVIAQSFREQIVLIYDEVLPVEVLMSLHSWVNTKSCNISNVVLLTTHTIGASAWYQQITTLLGDRKFRIVEAPLMSDRYKSRLSKVVPDLSKFNDKRIEYYFSYYGGTHGSLDRDFLTAALLDVDVPKQIDYLAGFASPQTEFLGYLEQITGFMDKLSVDSLLAIQQNTTISSLGTVNESFDMKGYQYQTDSVSACQLLRETLNDIPYTIITEKTIRSFLHKQHAIPVSGVNSVNEIEKLGFKFDHTLIDYTYQTEPIFYERVRKITRAIYNLQKRYSLSELNEYINNENCELLQYNYNYIASGEFFARNRQHVLNALNH